jgi:hypothetical protein
MTTRPFRLLAPFLCALALAVTTSSAAAPLQDIQGEYAGALKSKNQVIDVEAEEPGSDTSDAGLVVNQEGTSVEAWFVVFGEGDEEDFYVYMTGRAGNGKFHLAGENEEGFLVLTGTMKGGEGKRSLKAKGVFVAPSHYSDIKVVLKEGDSGIEL